jgi:Uma2 family endonuclease
MEIFDEVFAQEIEKPMSSINHSRIERRLNVLLTPFEDNFDIMPQLSLDLLGEKTTPDISICKSMTFDWQNDEIRLSVPPITTIEILSPKQALTDITDKIFKNYFPAGVKSAWLIIPTLQTIYIILPQNQIFTYTKGEFTDPATHISMKVEDIFR